MGKNRLALHLAAILGIVFFAFLAIGSDTKTTTPAVIDTSTEVKLSSGGNRVDSVRAAPGDRQYETLGLVFATSTTKLENGREIANEEDVIILLLKEAQKLGGNDIVNYRWSENTVTSQEKRKEGGSEKTINTKTVTRTGVALAIKYRNGADAIVPAAYSSSGGAGAAGGSSSGGANIGNLVPNKFTLEGTVK